MAVFLCKGGHGRGGGLYNRASEELKVHAGLAQTAALLRIKPLLLHFT